MISIITPSYNSEKYIEACIISIKNQTFQNFEHIIVDGGSTDRTVEIIKKYEGEYPMRWISEKDKGMYDGIRKGFEMAKGEVFCWLNSDDIYMPWTLEIVSLVLSKDGINWCVGLPAQINDVGLLYFPVQQFITFPRFCIKRGWMDGRRLGCVQQESTFWTKELYESVGGIDASYEAAGDYDLWYRFAQKEKLWSLNSVLAGFRVHEGQKSEDRQLYCDEAHKLTAIEKVLNKLKVYKAINYLLKKRELVIDVRSYINGNNYSS